MENVLQINRGACPHPEVMLRQYEDSVDSTPRRVQNEVVRLEN